MGELGYWWPRRIIYWFNELLKEWHNSKDSCSLRPSHKIIKFPKIIYPPNPGSIYHLTKVLDHQLLQFYKKNWNIPITDLHQGIVWGTQSLETRNNDILTNRFDYDGIYGTVLNRFIVQALNNHPITVYGTGGQTRAFIHIDDTAECIKIAVENLPISKNVRVLNQVSETHSVIDLAKIVSHIFGSKIINYDKTIHTRKTESLWNKKERCKNLSDPKTNVNIRESSETLGSTAIIKWTSQSTTRKKNVSTDY